MMSDDLPRPPVEDRPMWNAFCEEAREIAWLASLVGGLSVAGVGLAIIALVAV
jgi:hypothetical protein